MSNAMKSVKSMMILMTMKEKEATQKRQLIGHVIDASAGGSVVVVLSVSLLVALSLHLFILIK